jgi:hypothetical protein
MENYFITLNNINVNEHAEKKNGLTYLSWAWAWAEVKKKFPDANYTIYQNESLGGMPYFTDGKTAIVKTGVTINGIEHIEFLPVMDYKNKSIPVANITSFDVNKAIQRSLTKAVARHGLGLYIYAGEDLPEEENKAVVEKAVSEGRPVPYTKEAKQAEMGICEKCGKKITDVKQKDGTIMNSIAVEALARSKTGKSLCADCLKGAKK